MKAHVDKPAFHLIDNPELTLPGCALANILQTIMESASSTRIKVGGCSMSPFIRNGDIVTLAPRRLGSLRIGDVVAFRFSGGRRIAFHRIVRMIAGFYLIRGDYRAEADGLISTNDILGVVKAVERGNTSVHFGLGFERLFIAFLSAMNVLFPLLSLVYGISNRRRASSGRRSLAPTIR